MGKYTTVLFDLDGTILDTNELIISSFLHTLNQYYPEKAYTRDHIIPHMGKTLVDMMTIFAEEAETDTERIQDMIQVYREHNLRVHDDMVEAFPHAYDVIQTLHDRGVKLGIVTTKQRKTAMMGLELCGLKPFMQTVITIQDVDHPKPHPEPVLKAMSELGALAPTTLMVGDSRYDIESAQRAGIDSAGVAWTLKGVDYLQSFSPTYMLESMQDLLTIQQELSRS
ncbi:pyrophosphatase PpaX [Caldalkalibacillus salinus]|uniref:pyrophosphatase PpaX n=1 Tax=Caldalkalibacillus salinus TaxID=2803787 RepID=UPI001923E4C8|nr:pyrophosphatase PpaX [Caldalkalibacillus salinus]